MPVIVNRVYVHSGKAFNKSILIPKYKFTLFMVSLQINLQTIETKVNAVSSRRVDGSNVSWHITKLHRLFRVIAEDFKNDSASTIPHTKTQRKANQISIADWVYLWRKRSSNYAGELGVYLKGGIGHQTTRLRIIQFAWGFCSLQTYSSSQTNWLCQCEHRYVPTQCGARRRVMLMEN